MSVVVKLPLPHNTGSSHTHVGDAHEHEKDESAVCAALASYEHPVSLQSL